MKRVPDDVAVALLVVAKAPVPGLAKTRLAAVLGDRAAAEIAAAALLDTLDTVARTPAAARVVAFTGDLDKACCADELRTRLADFTVVDQRGPDFAHRLANAHADAAAATGNGSVFQIGMDTPQLSSALLAEGMQALRAAPAVLGLARDGGWWALGVRDAADAACLQDVPMSRADTGAVTLGALRDTGMNVTLIPELRDVDTVDDIDDVRAACPPDSRFARATTGVRC